MARIEQRVCDRCFRKDENFEDHGWSELEVGSDAQFDLCRGCSKDLVFWIGAGRPEAKMLPSVADQLATLSVQGPQHQVFN